MVFARPLRSDELEWVASFLTPELWGLFAAQQVADQRHGFESGQRMLALGGGDRLIVTALLHDVGKSHSQLGPIRRSVATILMALRLPKSRRMKLYRDHGQLGARDLEAAGAPGLVVSFARHHQFGRPPDIDPVSWEMLRSADMGTER